MAAQPAWIVVWVDSRLGEGEVRYNWVNLESR